jgi:hypothetical protein
VLGGPLRMLELQKNLAGVGQFAVGRENVTAAAQMFSHSNSQPFSISARNNYRFPQFGLGGKSQSFTLRPISKKATAIKLNQQS